uniref:G_PROTEIN_RECEP_F1_2 domain-containing protein n=1 Tax=Steinernema glaseri TaxID=37863 RepID=A0A1I8AHG7_9BILA
MSGITTTTEMSLANSRDDDRAAVCKVMLRFADTPAVITAFAVKLCCGLSALLLFAWLAKVRPRNRTLHINAYNILYAHFIFVLISSFGVVLNDGFDLTRLTLFRREVDYSDGSGDCGIFSMPAKYGVWIRLITFFGNTGSTLTMSALAVERTYATIQSRSYESDNKPCFGRLLVCLAVLVNLGLKTFIAVHINYRRYLPMQSLSAEAAPYATCVLYINTGCEVFNIFVFVTLWISNHKWKKSVGRILATLTHKYQVEENMKSVAIMISLASLHFLINIIAYLIQLYGTWHDETPQEKMEYVIKGDVAPTYDFLLPLLTLCRIYYKKRRDYKCSTSRIVSPVENLSTNDHFNMLNGMFDKALDQNIAKHKRKISGASKTKVDAVKISNPYAQ